MEPSSIYWTGEILFIIAMLIDHHRGVLHFQDGIIILFLGIMWPATSLVIIFGWFGIGKGIGYFKKGAM